jgi:hypothetical protein
MTDQAPGAVPPATPMVNPSFGAGGWHLSPAEQSRVAATLAKHGITAAPTAPSPQGEPDAASPTPAGTFDAPSDPSAYAIHWPQGAFDIAADPAITAALGATNSVAANVALQGALRSGAQAMGLPKGIGGSVIESALEDMHAYSRMSDAERQLYDAEQQAAFQRVIGRDDLATAKKAVADLVSRWHAQQPALVETLLAKGLFKKASAFGQLYAQARRMSAKPTT